MGEDTSSDNIIFFELVIFLKYLVIKKLTWSSTTRFWTNNKHYHRSFVTRPLRENKNQNILILLIIGMNIALRNTIQTAMPIIYQNFFKKKKRSWLDWKIWMLSLFFFFFQVSYAEVCRLWTGVCCYDTCCAVSVTSGGMGDWKGYSKNRPDIIPGRRVVTDLNTVGHTVFPLFIGIFSVKYF